MTTTLDAEDPKLMVVPLTTTVPPGVNVSPGPKLYSVAALAVYVVEPTVMRGISDAAPDDGNVDVTPLTTTKVEPPEVPRLKVEPPAVTAEPPA